MRSILVSVVIVIATFATCRGVLNLEQFLQPDNASDFYQFDGRTCTRECQEGSPPRICYYRFYLDDYTVLSSACQDCPQNIEHCLKPQCVLADGYKRGISVVNRKLPGPSIQVCYGDRIIVDVINNMPGKATTIHWHGIFQRGTPYYDGTPLVTQCPIVEGNSFRYDFYANQTGTFFWHSHEGVQKVDGLQGSLIIRPPLTKDVNHQLYDYDFPAHVMVIMDWYHGDSSQYFPGIVDLDPDRDVIYYLINGLGRFTDPHTGSTTRTPYSVFRVTQGNRYRFRIIGALSSDCPARISVQGHNLTLIATDGNAVEPVVVDHFDLFTGERYDFVLNAVNEVNSYWIKVRGLGECEDSQQLAVLQYAGSPYSEPISSTPVSEHFNFPGIRLNPENATCGIGQNGICVNQLRTTENFNRRILTAEPDVDFTMEFGQYAPTVQEAFQSGTYQRFSYDDEVLFYQINGISFKAPPSPVLSQRRAIQDSFCPTDSNGVPKCDKEWCTCFHVFRVPLNSTVQFILLDKSVTTADNHPFHLHGYAFSVMAMGYLNEDQHNGSIISDLIRRNEIQLSSAPPLKDTLAVPNAGYAVVRIVADNPGYWMFHCHFLFHHVAGMAVVIQVGDAKDKPPIPHGFPKCGNFLPSLNPVKG